MTEQELEQERPMQREALIRSLRIIAAEVPKWPHLTTAETNLRRQTLNQAADELAAHTPPPAAAGGDADADIKFLLGVQTLVDPSIAYTRNFVESIKRIAARLRQPTRGQAATETFVEAGERIADVLAEMIKKATGHPWSCLPSHYRQQFDWATEPLKAWKYTVSFVRRNTVAAPANEAQALRAHLIEIKAAWDEFAKTNAIFPLDRESTKQAGAAATNLRWLIQAPLPSTVAAPASDASEGVLSLLSENELGAVKEFSERNAISVERGAEQLLNLGLLHCLAAMQRDQQPVATQPPGIREAADGLTEAVERISYADVKYGSLHRLRAAQDAAATYRTVTGVKEGKS